MILWAVYHSLVVTVNFWVTGVDLGISEDPTDGYLVVRHSAVMLYVT